VTIPLTYNDLSPREQRWMCNGCGPKLGVDIDVVPDFIFHDACERHDFDYWLGFSEGDRARADRRFLVAMQEAARACSGWWSRRWYSFLAWRYYWAVRWLGKGAFSYRERYGTREDLEREMAEDD